MILNCDASFFTVYLGLNKPVLKNNKSDGTIWYFPMKDINEIFCEVFNGKETYLREGVFYNFSSRSKESEYLFNKDIHEVFYISVTANFRNRNYWRENKEIIADELIKRANEIFPAPSSSIMLRLISAPYDIERYTLNYQGTTSGWACIPEQLFFL